jgi:hypothetical protein
MRTKSRMWSRTSCRRERRDVVVFVVDPFEDMAFSSRSIFNLYPSDGALFINFSLPNVFDFEKNLFLS